MLAAPGQSAVRQRRRSLRFKSFIGWILFSVFVSVVLKLLPVSAVPSTPPPSLWYLPGLYASVVGGFLIFVAMRLFRWSAWVNFKRNSGDLSLSFSDAGIEQNRPGVRTVMHWAHFTGLAERKGVYAIRQANNDGLIVPQSLFTPEDLPRIDKLLKEKLAARVPLLAAGFEVRTT